MFEKIPKATLKEGVFVGPQIREVLKDHGFEESLTFNEIEAWKAFVWVCKNFLGNLKLCEYENCIQKLLNSLQKVGCRMSLKMHFLHSHLAFFPENTGTVSDEQGERFHQDIQVMEKRYQGFWYENMLATLRCFIVMNQKKSTKGRIFTEILSDLYALVNSL